MVPMVIVDNSRRFLEANRPARLLLRASLSELRHRRIDDFTPRERLSTLEVTWSELLAGVPAAGMREISLRDGSRFPVVYCRLANLLPGAHLTIFAPADWPEDELAMSGSEADRPVLGLLSPREREVLSLVAVGADLQQIASELTISPATVRTHIANANRKLGTHTRAHAVMVALRQGAIDPPEPPN